jgi:phenylalanyl-tRNA synthetase beta chain
MAFVLADDVVAGDLAKALRGALGDLAESVSLFDVYRGTGVEHGSRSLAFRIKISAEDRTLDEAEITSVRDACIASASNLGATLR